jgi:hypothetical protein
MLSCLKSYYRMLEIINKIFHLKGVLNSINYAHSAHSTVRGKYA